MAFGNEYPQNLISIHEEMKAISAGSSSAPASGAENASVLPAAQCHPIFWTSHYSCFIVTIGVNLPVKFWSQHPKTPWGSSAEGAERDGMRREGIFSRCGGV